MESQTTVSIYSFIRMLLNKIIRDCVYSYSFIPTIKLTFDMLFYILFFSAWYMGPHKELRGLFEMCRPLFQGHSRDYLHRVLSKTKQDDNRVKSDQLATPTQPLFQGHQHGFHFFDQGYPLTAHRWLSWLSTGLPCEGL